MKKLVRGIVDFHAKIQPGYREKFARLALGQYPDALLIACSDSRVAPNVFASTDPGDLFVVRNVGNLIPCCGDDGRSTADESEAAAIEFAVSTLGVANIIVCGHSECAAMKAIVEGRERVKIPHLRAWLRHGEASRDRAAATQLGAGLSEANRVSQANVLLQMEHMATYPVVRERLAAGKLRIHGWWFELSTADVYSYDEREQKFVVIDEAVAEHILNG